MASAEIVLFVAGLVLGGAIGYGINWKFARESSKELRTESEKLRRLSSIMLGVMEQQGLIKLNRDERGEITGQIHELSLTGVSRMSGSAKLTDLSRMPDDSANNSSE